MAEEDLQCFLAKVEQLNAFVALSRSDAGLGEALRNCADHHSVVGLARQHGFEIGRRWGEGCPSGEGRREPEAPNLLASPCPEEGQERTERLLEAPGLLLERIHSCAYSGGWQEQPGSEWVMVLSGSAQLQFADEASPRQLREGDTVLIAPGRRHRVVATDPAPGTLWLTLTWTP
ncbi:Nif11 domain/cupin domain-containing protein [Synechococcus sp. Tobar12-5m-g]|uniref:Nif11 domain/cupin domain-containing protein n=1 Tax=unclassified Synechococcus TaxID=2626047 RepID=UPI0020CB7AF0|nr:MULTISPECIES: Nif11 domain/cupin domain-containing protein [unclassified Synechococcus]MCP9772953.1 Nif11 domain/cupin domain-containing protein [Synechococcus sp. Tobar12-5m-g]MCP9873734.1 Nif11 domain/cupin domain-containing protein [Synechococcus sp. Cruz CV-v-12]